MNARANACAFALSSNICPAPPAIVLTTTGSQVKGASPRMDVIEKKKKILFQTLFFQRYIHCLDESRFTYSFTS